MEPLSLDHPRLAPDTDLSRARQQLESYRPETEDQSKMRDRVLDFLDEHPTDAHQRTCLEGHLTASALVFDARCERVLLTHHRKLGRWLQLGGHCDGDANLPAVALREATEESGLENLVVVPEIIDVDIHPIPARPREPGHLHLDSRYFVIARGETTPRANHESNELRWFGISEARDVVSDESLLRLLELERPGSKGGFSS